MTQQRPFVIGIAGGTGSGKTTVVQKLLESYGQDQVVCIPHDNYYRDQSEKPLSERIRTNYDHPNALETELLIEHLQQLAANRSVRIPVYDFVQHTRAATTIDILPRKVILVEGILILDSKPLRELFDLKIFVDTDADVRFIRRLTRDIAERGRTVESVIGQYLSTVKPMHEEFVEPSKRYADIIFPEGGYNAAAVDVLIARIRQEVGV